jgi:hypothetical protein
MLLVGVPLVGAVRLLDASHFLPIGFVVVTAIYAYVALSRQAKEWPRYVPARAQQGIPADGSRPAGEPRR